MRQGIRQRPGRQTRRRSTFSAPPPPPKRHNGSGLLHCNQPQPRLPPHGLRCPRFSVTTPDLNKDMQHMIPTRQRQISSLCVFSGGVHDHHPSTGCQPRAPSFAMIWPIGLLGLAASTVSRMAEESVCWVPVFWPSTSASTCARGGGGSTSPVSHTGREGGGGGGAVRRKVNSTTYAGGSLREKKKCS